MTRWNVTVQVTGTVGVDATTKEMARRALYQMEHDLVLRQMTLNDVEVKSIKKPTDDTLTVRGTGTA